MNGPLQFTPQAAEDLDAIWCFIAEDNRDAADRVAMEIIETCRRLARHPRMGTKRQDIPKFPNYVIVYRPDTAPLQVVAVLNGKRDLKAVLEGRSQRMFGRRRSYLQLLPLNGSPPARWCRSIQRIVSGDIRRMVAIKDGETVTGNRTKIKIAATSAPGGGA